MKRTAISTEACAGLSRGTGQGGIPSWAGILRGGYLEPGRATCRAQGPRFHYDKTAGRGGGPSGWFAAAILIRPGRRSGRYSTMPPCFKRSLLPPFRRGGVNNAYVCLKSRTQRRLWPWTTGMNHTASRCVFAVTDLYHVKILLPEGVERADIQDCATGSAFTGMETIEEARYITLDMPAPNKRNGCRVCALLLNGWRLYVSVRSAITSSNILFPNKECHV